MDERPSALAHEYLADHHKQSAKGCWYIKLFNHRTHPEINSEKKHGYIGDVGRCMTHPTRRKHFTSNGLIVSVLSSGVN